jgi:hypothetical protein
MTKKDGISLSTKVPVFFNPLEILHPSLRPHKEVL